MASDAEPNVEDAAGLQRTLIAVGLGWVVPGLGHVLVGRVRRGVLFGALVWASFGLGLAHDGRLALRDARQPLLTTLQVVANLGVGPADVVARLGVYGEAAYSLSARPARASTERRQQILRERARSAVSIYGTAYLWTAGLMNLLLLFDIWDIGMGRKP
jgi:hypothetical protein